METWTAKRPVGRSDKWLSNTALCGYSWRQVLLKKEKSSLDHESWLLHNQLPPVCSGAVVMSADFRAEEHCGLRERRGRERGDEDRQETDGWGTFLKSRAKTLGSLIKGSILYKVRLPCLLWLLSSSRLYIITVKVSKRSTHREMLTDLFQKLKHRLELCEVLRSQQRRDVDARTPAELRQLERRAVELKGLWELTDCTV